MSGCATWAIPLAYRLDHPTTTPSSSNRTSGLIWMEPIERTLPTEPTDDRSSDEKRHANGRQHSAPPTVPPSEGMVSPNQGAGRENDQASGETYEVNHTAGTDCTFASLPLSWTS